MQTGISLLIERPGDEIQEAAIWGRVERLRPEKGPGCHRYGIRRFAYGISERQRMGGEGNWRNESL